MANADKAKEQKEQEELKAEQENKKSLVGRFLPVIVLAVVVGFCTAAGFGLGRLLAGSPTPETTQANSASEESIPARDLTADGDSEKVWYYDLDPVVANLNEPSVTRYVRACFTLEMSSEVDQKKGGVFLNEKKPILIDWLTVYLSSLRLDDIRGDKNLKRIQSHIREAFNDKLFPDSKPEIKRVLIKEFPIQ
jgi:flagellar basal body-associated protein FliL